jgi:hypothetical protein
MSSSSPRRRGPKAPGAYDLATLVNKIINAFRITNDNGVWVPAFAGTTKEGHSCCGMHLLFLSS